MTLRLVHIEDNISDRELVAGILRADGIVCTITAVDSMVAFEDALADPPDVILADFSLPGFDGIAAQQLASSLCPDVPFVFVSGSMGEEVAVERLKEGATDYVLKHRLEKLPSAVRRAVREAQALKQRAEAEEDLRKLNFELEARVKERTHALKTANAALEEARLEAERANKAKSVFLSRMSHDLRTPLNAMLGFAQVMQLDNLTKENTESVAHILRAGRHLLTLINEVLDIARIEAGKLSLSLEPVDVADIVSQAVEIIRPLTAPKDLTIEVDIVQGTYVLADRQRLTQVLFNLLSNAVKYNRDRGNIRVSMSRDADRTTLVVADTGAGIPPEKVSRLFMPFERLGAEQSTTEGTGLGLALSKGLTEAMNGSLDMTSVVDQGSAFRVSLPPARAPSAARAESPESLSVSSVATHGTVLYIEDNPSNVRLMQVLLRARPGVRLLHASDGRTGMALIRKEHPDLVFLDLHLPDTHGEDVLQEIWSDGKTRDIPVVILSADASSSRTEQLLVSGATSYLTKPYDIAEVLQIVDRALVGHARVGTAK